MIHCIYMKRNYELAYLISGRLSPELALGNSQQIHESVQKREGLVAENRLPQPISLAYPIQKETAAYFAAAQITLEPAKLADLEQELKQNKEILRFLLIKKVKSRMKTIRRRPPKPESEVPAGSAAETKTQLSDIEKKLDEILK